MSADLQAVHRRLDQIEHMLNQNKHRQKLLDARADELATFRSEIQTLAASLEVSQKFLKDQKALTERLAAIPVLETKLRALEESVQILSQR